MPKNMPKPAHTESRQADTIANTALTKTIIQGIEICIFFL